MSDRDDITLPLSYSKLHKFWLHWTSQVADSLIEHDVLTIAMYSCHISFLTSHKKMNLLHSLIVVKKKQKKKHETQEKHECGSLGVHLTMKNNPFFFFFLCDTWCNGLCYTYQLHHNELMFRREWKNCNTQQNNPDKSIVWNLYPLYSRQTRNHSFMRARVLYNTLNNHDYVTRRHDTIFKTAEVSWKSLPQSLILHLLSLPKWILSVIYSNPACFCSH